MSRYGVSGNSGDAPEPLPKYLNPIVAYNGGMIMALTTGGRIILMLALMTGMSGCSAMLLGDGQTGSSSPAASDERSAAQASTDQAITRDVSSRLSANDHVGRFGIVVSTAKGTVKLSGTVNSFEARDKAVSIANSVDGVTSVNNQIRVDTTQ
jgi:osmotically-inducible protein OsmY